MDNLRSSVQMGFGGDLAEVRRKRIVAFILDFAFIIILCIPMAVIIAIFGFLTFSLGWLLFPILFPLVAGLYIGLTAGGAKQATPGMQMSGIKLQRMDGRPVDTILAIVHATLGWTIHAIATPLLAIVSLFADHKRLLHDILLGTVVVRAD